MLKKNEEFYRKENAKMKGDGQPYVEWLNEEYDKMTNEERKKVDEIEKKLNTVFGINDDDLVKSSMYGFIVGDALGVPAEFLSRKTLKNKPIQDMEEYGTHNQPRGTWSDDTSMVLATVDGILNSQILDIDYKKIITNFLNWKQKGEFTPYGKVFDIGNSTSYALSIYQQHIHDNNDNDVICGTGNINSNGNGSLMRILPISLYLYYLDINYNEYKFFEIIKIISSMTHSHIYSILGCYIYTIYCIELIKEKNKIIAYKNMQNILQNICDKNNELIDIKNMYGRIVYEDISKLEEKDIRSSGYVVDSLEATIWTILTTNSFEESVLKAVNLGEDTDTIGALTGGLAGIIYGYDSIPKKWINALQKKDYINELINSFITHLDKVKSINNGDFTSCKGSFLDKVLNEDIYIDFKSALKIAAKSTNEGKDLAVYTKDNKFITIHIINSENAIRAGYIPLVGYTEMLCAAEDIEDPMKGLRKYYKDIGDMNRLEYLEKLFYNKDKK